MSDSPGPDTLSLSAEWHVEAVCARFEEEWRAGRPPAVEQYLDGCPPGARAVLLRELLKLDLHYRRLGGEEPTLDDYRPRLPADGEVLGQVFPTTLAKTADAGGADTTSAPLPDGLFAGRYRVVALLGRGGMGIVYRAREVNLNREVALKTIPGADASRGTVARFWAEAEVMAAVKHPNVVPVYELGEHDGRPFMAMEYVAGGSLAKRLGLGSLPPRSAAELLEKVARGVAAAHELGIVHRDLKPANVLLDGAGEPKVADFGLAKRPAHDLTQTQALMGTPAYMAPEQAARRAKFVGPAADVWALGVILYECVAGACPFDADTAEGLLSQIRSAEPAGLRKRARGVPRDLDTIVSKCLMKEPEYRYPTAAELADDLARFARGEPIAARPVIAAERLVRWARRKPTAAAAWGLSAVAVVLALGVFIVAGLWRKAEGARVSADAARAGEEEQRRAVQGLLEIEMRLRGELQSANGQLESARDGEARAKREIEFLNYVHAVELAHREYQANKISNLFRARELLDACPPYLRGWEWHYVHRLCHADLVTLQGHTDRVWLASFSTDGKQVVAASHDRTARVWDAITGQELAVLKGHTGVVWSASFSADGRRVVTASEDGTARVWDAVTGNTLVTLKGHAGVVKSASFSADGRRVVTASHDRTARVWDAATGKELAVLNGHTEIVTSASFSPDGKQVVAASHDRTARVWDAATGKDLAVLKGHTERVVSASFSADGGRVVTASWDATARVWDASTGNTLVTLKGHTRTVWSASFSADGKQVVTASWDATARVWDASTGRVITALRGHTGNVQSASFSTDGRRVVTASPDGTARLWDADTGQELVTFRGHTGAVSSASFSPDGRRVVTASADKTVRVWDADGDEAVLRGHAGTVYSASFSPDGRRVVTASVDGTTRVWDARTGKELSIIRWHALTFASASFSPDGRRVVTALGDKTARVWEPATGRVVAIFWGHTDSVASASFSPDGRRVVTGSRDGTARVWEVVEPGSELGAGTRNTLAVMKGHVGAVVSVGFSVDGRRVVTGSEDRTARVWDADTGNLLFTLEGHTSAVYSASFLADGRRVVTGSEAGQVRLWDADTGKNLAVLRGHAGRVNSATLSADEKRLLTASSDGTTRLWDADTGKLLLTLSGRIRGVRVAQFSDDGTRILTAGTDKEDSGPNVTAGSKLDLRVVVYDARPVNRAFLLPEVAPPPRMTRD